MTRYQVWREDIVVKEFSSLKAVKKYINSKKGEGWKLVYSLPSPGYLIFDRDLVESEGVFVSDQGQFIDPDFYFLYDVSVRDFLSRFNIPDIDALPILRDFFADSRCEEEEVAEKIVKAGEVFDIKFKGDEGDIAFLDGWVLNEEKNEIKPRYYFEKYYAFMILVVGEVFRNKNPGYSWSVRYVEMAKKEGFESPDGIYVPYLQSREGVFYDILSSFRQNLFLSKRKDKKISSVYKNIEPQDEAPRKWNA